MSDYANWFESSQDLSQGSFAPELHVFIQDPESTTESPQFLARKIHAVVLTQSCDLQKRSQDRILVAEVESYEAIRARGGEFASRNFRTKLAQGVTIAEFLIPPCEPLGQGWGIVNFRELHVVPKTALQAYGSWTGLNSPYREHLAQAYARFTMRVGLPLPLQEFESYS